MALVEKRRISSSKGKGGKKGGYRRDLDSRNTVALNLKKKCFRCRTGEKAKGGQAATPRQGKERV